MVTPDQQNMGRFILYIILGCSLIQSSALGQTVEEDEKAPSVGDEIFDLDLDELTALRIDSMATLGVHHTHDRGEWMLGYSYMFMEMIGNRVGTRRIDVPAVHADYMVAPTRMSMEMHMLHLMYAPTDDLTLMAMAPYHRVSMDHITRTGTRFTTDSEGFGDLEVHALCTFFRDGPHRAHLDLGVSVPTGSISERGDTPAGSNQRLPYPMQLGSGTVDLKPAAAYIWQDGSWVAGVTAGATLRMSRNHHDYRLGNAADASVWGGVRPNDWLSVYARVLGHVWDDIHGADPALNPMMVPTADPLRRAGRRVTLLFGLNVFQEEGPLEGQRLSVEFGVPIYQSLDGPQLESDWQFATSWQWTF